MCECGPIKFTVKASAVDYAEAMRAAATAAYRGRYGNARSKHAQRWLRRFRRGGD